MALFKKLTCAVLFTAAFFLTKQIVRADDPCVGLSGQSKIDCYNKKVSETQSQEKTLSSQIDLINNKISLTKSQISVTQDRLDRLTDSISSVSGKIINLEDSLTSVSTVLANRVAQTYMVGRNDPALYLLSATNFSDFWQRFEYLRIVQKHDKELMIQMAASRKNYNDQKVLLEDKKKQVEVLSIQLKNEKASLDRQNQDKQALLAVTQNDEVRYQQLLAFAQQELSALQSSQFTGKRDVKKGDVIGLMGNTGYSFGAHLHFGVYNLSEGQAGSFIYSSVANNPLDYLKSRNLFVDSGACYDKSGQTDLGGGSWDWPMDNPRFSQCYGVTPASASLYPSLRFHYGIDMYNNGNITIHAIEDGVAYSYRGSGSLGNNVRIFHSNGKMTLYLHLQ